ncbi:MAG: hypothetical protein IPM82_16220 [Saprospiraceae bacterium]|nr:hypothetical protein [Saprospiraceae bacterium]
MARLIKHEFLNTPELPNSQGVYIKRTYPVKINRVGEVRIIANAIVGIVVDDKVKLSTVNCGWTLFDPLGNEFKKKTISMSDLNKYRDLQGFIRPWKLEVSELRNLPLYWDRVRLSRLTQSISVEVFENLENLSAPPLINKKTRLNPGFEISFDLYRCGNLKLKVTEKSSIPMPFIPEKLVKSCRIRLFKPDGNLFEEGQNGELNIAVTPQMIRWSRDNNGKVKKWKIIIHDESDKERKILRRFMIL